MANIGASQAFYRVETSLTRANTNVNNSMVRLSTGKQQANAGDNSSYVAMGATFKVDYSGTQAGMKNIAVVQGFIDTAVAVLDQATNLNAKLMELAILANNDTNTSADLENIQAEYDAMTAELSAILASTYKGADLFQSGMSVGVDGRTNTKSYGVASPTVSGMAQTLSTGSAATSALVTVQTALNTARSTLGANSAALAATADYLTDLTAMYEIGFNTVNDVNFSLETAILAKNQILQQASTAMLAQANTSQQGLLQLIQR